MEQIISFLICALRAVGRNGYSLEILANWLSKDGLQPVDSYAYGCRGHGFGLAAGPWRERYSASPIDHVKLRASTCRVAQAVID